MFGLRWLEALFLPTNSPAHRWEPKHRKAMAHVRELTNHELGRLWATRNLKSSTAEQVVAELQRRQEERLNRYSYYGSKQHLEDVRRQMVADTHPESKPPWEDDDNDIYPTREFEPVEADSEDRP